MSINQEPITMTPAEFLEYLHRQDAAKTVPEDDFFILNRDTGKIELHFDKGTYDALSDDQKRKVKSSFLWGRNSGCWISRCKWPNLYTPRRVAAEIGLADAGEKGERPSFAEQQERTAERAEHRAERMEAAADRAAARGEALQKPITDMHGDIAFFTQPNINTTAGRAFTKRREKMFASFERGFEEFNKSEYYRQRAATATKAASNERLNDRSYLSNRINEAEKEIRAAQKRVEANEEWVNSATPENVERAQAALNDQLDRLEFYLDKLGYYQDALEKLGGVKFSKANIKPGDKVRISRFNEVVEVVSAGPKNIKYKCACVRYYLQASYIEILEKIEG